MNEQRRAFSLWKSQCISTNQKYSNFKILIIKRNKFLQGEAMNTWKIWSQRLGLACRFEMLKRQYTHNLYMNGLQSQLQHHSVAERHLKQTKLIRFWKYWQDYIRRKKFKFQLNKTASMFLHENTKQTKLEVFTVLRFNKEQVKVAIMESAVSADVDVSLQKLQAFVGKATSKDRATK